jgi:hypothetical protein
MNPIQLSFIAGAPPDVIAGCYAHFNKEDPSANVTEFAQYSRATDIGGPAAWVTYLGEVGP